MHKAFALHGTLCTIQQSTIHQALNTTPSAQHYSICLYQPRFDIHLYSVGLVPEAALFLRLYVWSPTHVYGLSACLHTPLKVVCRSLGGECNGSVPIRPKAVVFDSRALL